MKDNFRELLKKLVIRDTNLLKSTFGPPADLLAKLSDKGKAIYTEILTREFGVPKDNIRALAAALLEEELPPIKDNKDKWIFDGCGYIAIKILVTPQIDGADYFKKDSVLVRLPGYKYDDREVYKRGFISVKGGGTAQANLTRDQFSFATNEEIGKFIDDLGDSVIGVVKNSIVILAETDL